MKKRWLFQKNWTVLSTPWVEGCSVVLVSFLSRKHSKYCKTCCKTAGVGKSAAVIIKGCYYLLCEVAEYLYMGGIHQLEANRAVTPAPIHGPEQGHTVQAAHQPHWQWCQNDFCFYIFFIYIHSSRLLLYICLTSILFLLRQKNSWRPFLILFLMGIKNKTFSHVIGINN